jgi:hypothetical protein
MAAAVRGGRHLLSNGSPSTRNHGGRRSVHGDPVGVGGFADWLEEGGATGRAVAAASGGESQRPRPVVERAAGVAWLGTDVGLNQPTHHTMETTAVADRDVQRGDGA